MLRLLYFPVFLVFVGVRATNPPVLIWSPNRPMGDLPQSYAGSSITDKEFHESYIKPLTANPSQSLVVFMQDKLSVEDFTNHADVYNPDSDGGAFKNVKSAIDEQYSVHLPSVNSPVKVIQDLSDTFQKVVKVDNPEMLADVNMDAGKGALIIVTLSPVQASDEASSFKKNDEMIGQCLHHLNKRGIQYSAIYTAEAPSKVVKEEQHDGRQLLQADEAAEDNSFFYSDGVMIYLAALEVKMTKSLDDDKTKIMTSTFPLLNTSVKVSERTNQSFLLDFEFNDSNGTVEIQMLISESEGLQYRSMNGTFKYTPDGSSSEFLVNETPIDYKIEATKGYCFHCSKLVQDFESKNESIRVQLTWKQFQFEAFNEMNNSTQLFTLNVWDCVEFFTVPIWMGLLVTFLLMIILFYGLTALASITTMDRFDDPKGKTITVTVNE